MNVSWCVLAVANACQMGCTGAVVNNQTKNYKIDISGPNIYFTVIYLTCGFQFTEGYKGSPVPCCVLI